MEMREIMEIITTIGLFVTITVFISFIVLFIKRRFGWFDLTSPKNAIHSVWQVAITIYALNQILNLFIFGELDLLMGGGFGYVLLFFIVGNCILWSAVVYVNLTESKLLNRVHSFFFKYFLFVFGIFLTVSCIVLILYALDFLHDNNIIG